MDDAPFEANKVLKSEEFSALSRARTGVLQAQEQAAAIVAQANQQAAQILAQAEEDGRRRVSVLLSEHVARMSEDLATTEAELTEALVAAIERLIAPLPPVEQIAAAARRALKEVDLSREVELIVGPDKAGDLGEVFKGINHLHVRGDPMIPDGSSLLRTPYGDIELNLRTQLTAMAEGLRAALATPDDS